jgi:uncharacterized membrane protein
MQIRLIGIAALMFALTSCKHHPEDSELLPPLSPPDTIGLGTPCDENTVYFKNTILPLLISRCAQPGCHDALTQEDGVRLDNYDDIMQQVDAGDLDGSDLWEVINETDPDKFMPPSPNTPLTNEERERIRQWILQGAQNNECTSCDSTQGSFSANIFPIVQLHCQGCHSGASPQGDVSLENYNQIKSLAESGLLMSVLIGANGSPIMPYNTLGLPQCYKDQFQNWIDAGALDN